MTGKLLNCFGYWTVHRPFWQYTNKVSPEIELLNGTKNEEDPLKQRPRAELWKLKRLAELAGGMGEPSG